MRVPACDGVLQNMFAVALGVWAASIGDDCANLLGIFLLSIVFVLAVQSFIQNRSEKVSFSKGIFPCKTSGSSSTTSSPRSGGSVPTRLGQLKAIALNLESDDFSWFIGQVARIFELQLSDVSSYEPPERLRCQITSALIETRSGVKNLLSTTKCHMDLHDPIDDLIISRFLIATGFNVTRTLPLLQGYLDWRSASDGGEEPNLNVIRSGMFMVPFEDKLGRPVLIIRTACIDASAPIEQIRQTFRAIMDAFLHHSLRKRRGPTRTNPLEQYVCLVDAQGAGWKNVRLGIVKMLVQETNMYFPDMVQEIYILSVSHMVHTVWNMAVPLLHPRTRKKVKLVKTDDVPSTLQGIIDEHLLPTTLGGLGPPFVLPSEANNLSEAVGQIAATGWRHFQLDDVFRPKAPGGQVIRDHEFKITVSPRCSNGASGLVYDIHLHDDVNLRSRSSTVVRTAMECGDLFDRLGEARLTSAHDVEHRLNRLLHDSSPSAKEAVLRFVGGGDDCKAVQGGSPWMSCFGRVACCNV